MGGGGGCASYLSDVFAEQQSCLFVRTSSTHLFWRRTLNGNVHRCCGRLPASSLSQSLYGSSPQPKKLQPRARVQRSKGNDYEVSDETLEHGGQTSGRSKKEWAVKRVICMGLLCER